MFEFFKNKYILRAFILFFLLIILLVLFKTTIDIYNFKLYFSILFLNTYVLKFLTTKFEQTEEIQYLNLLFLYLNLTMLVLFFFDDLEFICLELIIQITKLWNEFWKEK